MKQYVFGTLGHDMPKKPSVFIDYDKRTYKMLMLTDEEINKLLLVEDVVWTFTARDCIGLLLQNLKKKNYMEEE